MKTSIVHIVLVIFTLISSSCKLSQLTESTKSFNAKLSCTSMGNTLRAENEEVLIKGHVTTNLTSALTHEWVQKSGPAVQFVLQDPASSEWRVKLPSVDKDEEATFRLKVASEIGICETDALTITIKNIE